MKATTIATILKMNAANATIADIAKATKCKAINVEKVIAENAPVVNVIDLAHNASAKVFANIATTYAPKAEVEEVVAPKTKLEEMLAAAIAAASINH